MDFDIALIGAGPAGLSMARALSGTGLRIALIEQQPAAAFADPADDGREIALSQRSLRLLRQFGLWEHIPADAIYPLEQAAVFNGDGRSPLRVRPLPGQTALGALVPNHHIRRAAWEAVRDQDGLTLLDGRQLAAIDMQVDGVRVALRPTAAAGEAAPQTLQARLLLAADSRFSTARRMLGVAADSHDFGKTMLVCRMEHAQPHRHTAWEWFGFGQTLAVLPLSEGLCSVVLTLPQREMDAVTAMSDAAFADDIARRLQHRLGDMRCAGQRRTYPLVGVYAQRFAGARFALIGDAAVGMHPVTAHGFNFGLHGVDLLAAELRGALRAGADIGAAEHLQRYARAHRRATRALYLATQAIATLYTDDRSPARQLRALALDAARRFAPLRLGIAAALSEDGLRLRNLLPGT